MSGLCGNLLKQSLALLCLGGVLIASWGKAQAGTPGSPGTEEDRWAFLIGVQKYRHAPSLLFAHNDVWELADTLEKRGGYDPRQIFLMTDLMPGVRFLPERENILKELPPWLSQVGPQSLVLVYFSGHAFLGSDGNLYLAPLDCDPQRPEETGIPVTWLRQQLEACGAETKFLILDVCHAGAEGDSPGRPLAPVDDVTKIFERARGVITLASCRAEEKSLEWPEMRHSVFSYWLIQGLRGHADQNWDRGISVAELYEYVLDRVPRTAERVFGRRQTPVWTIGPNTSGVPVIIRPKAAPLKETLDELAEQIALAIIQHELSPVGVLEDFTSTIIDPQSRQKVKELLGEDLGVLGRLCGKELHQRLEQKLREYAERGRSSGAIRLVSQKALHESLVKGGYTLKDLPTRAMRGLTVEEGQSATSVRAVVWGMVDLRTGWLLNLQCTLMGTEDQQEYGRASGTAQLFEEDWALLGRSIVVQPDDSRPSFGRDGKPLLLPRTASLITRWDERSEAQHPQAGESPFRVRLRVDGRFREGIFRGNKFFVPLRPGETYEIWVENRTDRPVMMRLLVDGLNTLPEPVSSSDLERSIQVEARELQATARPSQLVYLPAQRVSLDQAQAWLLPQRGTYAVRGFFEDLPKGRYRKFVVVDADRSLAARQGFTDQVGLITAAFYEAVYQSEKLVTRGPALGTDAGEIMHEALETYTHYKPGGLLAVIHLWYVHPDTLEEPASSSRDR